MLPLYLLAAHLVGDFLLQTRWQAMGKFGWTREAGWLRTKHVFVYCSCFLPILWTDPDVGPGAYGFLVSLYVLHFLTDAQRFPSNPGELLRWRTMGAADRLGEYRRRGYGGSSHEISHPLERGRMPSNPWPTMPLAIDQTLHVVQIAVLAGLFL